MRKKLVLMDAGMFCEGMSLKAKIYYFYKERYILLCKNVVFTKELVEKLYYIAEVCGGIYIEEDSYEEVWNESLRRYSLNNAIHERMYRKVRQEYDKILAKTAFFLGEIPYGKTISIEKSEEICEEISNDLAQFDQSMVMRCVNMIGEADNYLYTHCVNVAALNGLIGQWLSLSDIEIKQLIKVGLLHDLGKLMVPPKVLNKPGRLTEEEFEVIKRHPVLTYDMLCKSGETNQDVLVGVRHHHERPNGSGYPDQLVHSNISLFARITAISDVYDAMVSKRCYKNASMPFEVLAQFEKNQFFEFDSKIVNVFLNNIIYLFVGMNVTLSNGENGEIIFLPPKNLENPVIKVGNRVVTTSNSLKCVAIDQNF